jgi:hypothetical protein
VAPVLRVGIRLRIFQIRVKKRILGPRRWEVTGEGKNLQRGKFHG